MLLAALHRLLHTPLDCRQWDSPLPFHNQARLRLREVAVLHEMAKRMKEALDHLMKIHHFALVADRLQHPLVFVSGAVESRAAACSCGKNFRPQVFKRLVWQDCLVQRIERKSVFVILAWGKRYSHERFVCCPKNHLVEKRSLHSPSLTCGRLARGS